MADDKLVKEIERRKAFAIISHPDAGKTTLTEKFLLYGGAIRLAGSVKARRAQNYAVSDWMEIEKQRGISVTSSVLEFEYEDYKINILDTPGHQDFSEDTYRTLMAADSAVMVIDAAKGIEAQTKKLFHVCRKRGIPIFTFMNKLDRESRDPFELIQELEDVFGIRCYPMNWPIGSGKDFKGVYNRESNQIELFEGGDHGQSQLNVISGDITDEKFKDLLGEHLYEKLYEDISLLDEAGDKFNKELIEKGELTPVFFGSALTNFGVEPFLREFLKLGAGPSARNSDKGLIEPSFDKFSAFVFKIQANMNPAHRDRIAFMRICSGRFEKGMEVHHVQAGNKVRLTQPQQFLAQEKQIVEEAYPGDIIGVFDPGIFHIGDTLCEDNSKFRFEGIPVFAPENFMRVHPENSMKRKQFVKGITQLSEEGAVQIFSQKDRGLEDVIIGAVGVLQFEVFEYRLKHEYNVDIRKEPLVFSVIRWIDVESIDVRNIDLPSDILLVYDKDDNPALLFQKEWSIKWAFDRNPNIRLFENAPRYN